MALAPAVFPVEALRFGTPPSPGYALPRARWGDSAGDCGRGGALALVAREASSCDARRVGVYAAPMSSLIPRACGRSVGGHGRGGARAMMFFFHDDVARVAPTASLTRPGAVSGGGRGRTSAGTRTGDLFAVEPVSSAEAAHRLVAPLGYLHPRASRGSAAARFLASPTRATALLSPAAAVCRCSISSQLTSIEAASNTWGVLDSSVLSIDVINNSIMSQDVSIIQDLLERSQLCLNQEGYSAKGCKVAGFSGSWVMYVILEMEKSHAKAGRYKCPAEIPFFPDMLLEPLIPVQYPTILDHRSSNISLNKEIWQIYFGEILPKLAKNGADGHNGPSAVCDAKTLQALSKRIHYGMYLAEAKFRKSPETYEPAIKKQDPDLLRSLLTNSEGEDTLKRCEQLRTDVCQVLMNSGASTYNSKVKPEMVMDIFNQFVIPMSMEVQIQYLLLKGLDNKPASRVREDLSKRSKLLVKAGPPLALLTKVAGILTMARVVAAREKIFELLKAKGLVSNETALAAVALFLLAKEAIEVLKRGKECTELIRYYLKFWEKDKD